MENLILTDYIFLFILFVSTIFGFARGFLREVFTILNLALAAAATILVFPMGVRFMSQHLKDELTINASALVGSFVLCWVIIAVVNSFVIDALKFMRGGFIDRIMGIALGLARGALMVIGVYLGVVITVNAQNDDAKLPAWMREAKSLNYIKVQSEYVIAMMPKEYQDFYNNQTTSLSTALMDSGKDLVDTAKVPQLTEMGFEKPELQTFQELLSNVDDSLKVEDMNDFSPDTIKMLGDQAIEDYQRDITNGVKDGIADGKSSAKRLTEEQIRALKEQLSKIKVKDSW